MSETYGFAPPVAPHRDQPVSLEVLEHRQSGCRLELSKAERLAEREPLHHPSGIRVEVRQSRFDQFAQAWRRTQISFERPHARPADENVLGLRAEHELAQGEHVSAT